MSGETNGCFRLSAHLQSFLLPSELFKNCQTSGVWLNNWTSTVSGEIKTAPDVIGPKLLEPVVSG
jgi:hypothetical protein